MISIPYEKLLERMQEASGQSKDEIDKKIQAKLEELSGLISKEGAAHIVANEMGVNFEVPKKDITINNLAPGMRNLELIGKVRAVYEIREFNTATRSGKVANFLLTDTTGTTRIVLWNEMAEKLADIKEGDVIKLKDGYTRENNGRVEVHLGDNAQIYINPEGVTVDVDVSGSNGQQSADAPVKKIGELNGNDANVAVIATVVQVFDPRFFPVCPECNKKVQGEPGSYNCMTHGKVDVPAYNYVMNLYIDDGSDNIRCVLWREQINELLGIPQADIISMKDEPALFEAHKTDLLGMIVKVRGRVNDNQQFGRLELVGYEVIKNVNPEGEAESNQEKAEITPEKMTGDVANGNVTEESTESTVDAVVDEETGTVESISVNEENTTSVEAEDTEKKKPASNTKAPTEEEVFTLDDIEDLEDLE